MSRATLLMWAAVLLLGPSTRGYAADDSLTGLPLARSPAPRATIYTPAYAPAYYGIYTPAYAPPLTRTYVPAYARAPVTARANSWPTTQTIVRSNATRPGPKITRPEPTKEKANGVKSGPEAPPTPPAPPKDKPTPKPRKQTGSRPAHETDSATVILNVPATAAVWINGHKTTSQGTQRRFTSLGLETGFRYRYRIVVQDGDQQVERDVILTAGETELVPLSHSFKPFPMNLYP